MVNQDGDKIELRVDDLPLVVKVPWAKVDVLRQSAERLDRQTIRRRGNPGCESREKRLALAALENTMYLIEREASLEGLATAQGRVQALIDLAQRMLAES